LHTASPVRLAWRLGSGGFFCLISGLLRNKLAQVAARDLKRSLEEAASVRADCNAARNRPFGPSFIAIEPHNKPHRFRKRGNTAASRGPKGCKGQETRIPCPIRVGNEHEGRDQGGIASRRFELRPQQPADTTFEEPLTKLLVGTRVGRSVTNKRTNKPEHKKTFHARCRQGS
jgi:hypothetical protein